MQQGVSFSSTFYARIYVQKNIFGTKILYKSALCSFVIFGAKIMYKKFACKMLLIKLTEG